MTTFSLGRVRDFVDHLDARMSPPPSGTSPDPTVTATTLRAHMTLCDEFVEQIRAWGQSVFSGRTAFDPEVEAVWLAEGSRLAAHSLVLLRAINGHPLDDEVHGTFCSAVDRLTQLLDHWIRPQLAVGPGPRSWMHLTPEMIQEGRRRVAALPPLPADWVPADPDHLARFLKLRESGAKSVLNDYPPEV